MNFFTKSQLLIGAVILLAAINLAVLVTIGFHYMKTGKEIPPNTPNENRHSRFMAKELNLTPEQIQEFDGMRKEFMVDIRSIREGIRVVHRQTMEELSKEKANDQILDSLSNEIGRLHYMHHKMTIEHFKRMKCSANPDQQECLKGMFHRMMPMEDTPQRPRVRRMMKRFQKVDEETDR